MISKTLVLMINWLLKLMQILFYNCTFYIHNNPITWIFATLHNVFVEIIAVVY